MSKISLIKRDEYSRTQSKIEKVWNKAVEALGRKETVFYLNRAAKIKTKIYSKTYIDCYWCNGTGYLRVSLDAKKKCLSF